MRKKVDKLIQFLCVIFLSMWLSIVITSYIPIFPYFTLVMGLTLLGIWILDTLYHILRLRRWIKRIEGQIEFTYLFPAVIFLGIIVLLQVKPIQAFLQTLTPTIQKVTISYIAVGMLPSITLLLATFTILTLTLLTRRKYRRKYLELRRKKRTI